MKFFIFALLCSLAIQAQAASNNVPKHAAAHVLVRFKPGKAPANSGRSKGHPDLKRMPVLPNETVDQAVSRYAASQDVMYAEPDFIAAVTAIPSDTSFSSQWGMPKINAPAAWDKFTGSSTTKICIIDTGVDRNHPDLSGNVAVGYNAITGVADGMDDHSHGTHCAGTIGAKANNAQGIAGINWNVQILPCKFMSSTGSGYMSDAVECIYWCRDQGATISSNSWGSSGFSTSVYNAVQDVTTNNDHLFIASAGNSGKSNDNTTAGAVINYPAAFAQTLSSVIAVAAVDSSDNLASYSNYGPTSTALAAPGSSIYSTILAGSYGYKSGTSMAAPHVAGTAAFLKAADPTLTADEIKTAIVSSVDNLASLSGKVSSGGRLNLAKALAAAVPSLTPSPPPPKASPPPPSPKLSPPPPSPKLSPPPPSPVPSPSPSPSPVPSPSPSPSPVPSPSPTNSVIASPPPPKYKLRGRRLMA